MAKTLKEAKSIIDGYFADNVVLQEFGMSMFEKKYADRVSSVCMLLRSFGLQESGNRERFYKLVDYVFDMAVPRCLHDKWKYA